MSVVHSCPTSPVLKATSPGQYHAGRCSSLEARKVPRLGILGKYLGRQVDGNLPKPGARCAISARMMAGQRVCVCVCVCVDIRSCFLLKPTTHLSTRSFQGHSKVIPIFDLPHWACSTADKHILVIDVFLLKSCRPMLPPPTFTHSLPILSQVDQAELSLSLSLPLPPSPRDAHPSYLLLVT
jgi:hypothetical protein